MFSVGKPERLSNVLELNNWLNNRLKIGYYKQGNIFLDVNLDGHVRTIDIDVRAVPREYMDRGHYGFQF
ncbi:hypothetical protein J4416_02240 [Candidatus Pacearchaeota archaeon]|nr:hypothetical protein [Candidatus Pacearchaeota archaeon]